MTRSGSPSNFESNVFVNCPFDEDYYPLLRPLLFTVIYLGYDPRIASERSDSGENRINKISELIRDSKYGIHDLSRMRAAAPGELSRMNMPFELGIEYGCRLFGRAPLNEKQCLILEKERYEFMKALSDLSGVDIKSHANEPDGVVRAVRDWFVETVGLRGVASPTVIWYRFTDFAYDFYVARQAEGFTDDDLNMMPVPEYIDFIKDWWTKTYSDERRSVPDHMIHHVVDVTSALIHHALVRSQNGGGWRRSEEALSRSCESTRSIILLSSRA